MFGVGEPKVSGADTYTGTSSPTLDHIRATGKLRVGVSGAQPPFNARSRSGSIIGMDADLASALARTIDAEVEFVEKPFAQLLPALKAGEVDMVMSGMTMTPERNSQVAFAGPYFVSGKGLLTKSATLAETDEPEDINTQSLRLVALDGSTSQMFLNEAVSEATIIAARDYSEAVQLVIEGKADALVADFPACVVQMFKYPDAELVTVASPFTFEPLGAALPPNDPLFMNLVQNYFNMLEGTGLMDQLKAKWFLDGSWLAELE
jgi:polar amino acid transport system substrate-binding protein